LYHLIDPTTANLVIDELIKVFEMQKVYLSLSLVALACRSTTATSPLRKLLQDHSITGNPASSQLVQYFEDKHFHPDFIRDLLFEIWTLIQHNADDIISNMYYEKKLRPDRYHHEIDKIPAGPAGPTLKSES
jgi:hypothetical protein